MSSGILLLKENIHLCKLCSICRLFTSFNIVSLFGNGPSHVIYQTPSWHVYGQLFGLFVIFFMNKNLYSYL